MKKLLVVFALVLAACGGSDASDSPADDPTTTAAAAAVEDSTTSAPEPEETQPPTTEGPSPSSSGSIGIVLTIGDETWEFGGALCAFTGPKPGEEGSEWNVSQVRDGAQVYVSEDSFGPLVQYADISNGGNPEFNWEAGADGLSISVAGNDINATGEFTDSVGGTGPVAGTLSATCTDWFEG